MLNPKVLEKKNPKNQLVSLGTICGRKAYIKFNGTGQSQLGGMPLISQNKDCLDFLQGFAAQIKDTRDASKVKHSVLEMVTSTVGMIACGYEDRNDVTHLKGDPALQSLSNTLDQPSGLPSQPTLSRFERSVKRQDLYNLAWFFVRHFVKSYKVAPDRIVIDVDDSNFDVYGAQQLSLFNGYYGEYCYMPLFVFEAQSGKLILPILRPGRHNKDINVSGLLRRLFEYLHQMWPNTIIELRGDAHFCNHLFMDWAHGQHHIRYTTGLNPNVAVGRRVERLMEKAQNLHEIYPKLKDTWYVPFSHKMSTWKYEQQMVAKIEIDPLGVSVRYIVTNKMLYERYSPRLAYEYYRGRGRCELSIKNFKEMNGGRMSCHSFMANTFRFFLYAAAYVVLHTIKSEVKPKIKKGQKRCIKMGMSFHNFIYNVMRTPVVVKVTKTTITYEVCEHSYGHDILQTYYCTGAGKTA